MENKKKNLIQKVLSPISLSLLVVLLSFLSFNKLKESFFLKSGFEFLGLKVFSSEEFLKIQSEGEVLKQEQIALRLKNKSLQQKILELKKSDIRARNYKKGVEERLKKLDEVFRAAKELGVFHEVEFFLAQATLKTVDGGIGGLETECVAADESDCQNNVSGWDNESEREFFKDIVNIQGSNEFEILEHYLVALSTIPLVKPADGPFSSYFGPRKSPFGGKSNKFHQGLDIAVKTGSEVRSSASGVVANVRYNSSYGHYVDVQHSKSVFTRYAHLSKPLVKKGDRVDVNTVIALSGSTGRSTGPHLHYEVRVDNVPKNPLQLLKLGEIVDSIMLTGKSENI